MSVPGHIFKGYDIRGIYPDDYNEENIVQIVAAVYKFFQDGEDRQVTVVVGTDMRTSSPALTKAAIDTLVKMGAKVIDIGVVSTPTFYFAVDHYGYEAGFQITASHNPKEWNGLKAVKKGKDGLIKIGKSTGLETIREMATAGVEIREVPGGVVEKKESVLEAEVDNALAIGRNPKISEFKIVADAANAMGSQYINALFEKIPGNLIRMNFELDGTFPAHQPDPLQSETLVDLQKRVVAEGADLGLAPDGDGDRLFFIDEKGNIIPPTIITSMIAAEFLKENPGESILVDIRYLLTPKKIIEENGGKMRVVRVGHAYITESLNSEGGIFAGESSGHYFFRDTGNAESQMTTLLMVLKILSEYKESMSALVADFRRSFESGEINFKVENASEIMEAAKSKYSDGELNDMDGIAISYPSWRFSIRTSNTEPLLRLNLESETQEEMQAKRDELVTLIKDTAK